MSIGHLQPHLFVRNGVTYNCMKVMANALLDTMIRNEGKVNFRVLAHVHNLIPYSDHRVLEASSEELKLLITTVLKPVCKAVCLKTEERELVRQMLLKVGLVFMLSLICILFSSGIRPPSGVDCP